MSSQRFLLIIYNSSFIPARAAWGGNDGRRTLSPRPPASPVHTATTSGTAYYEDVDPRFDRRPSPLNAPHPSALTPGGVHCKSI